MKRIKWAVTPEGRLIKDRDDEFCAAFCLSFDSFRQAAKHARDVRTGKSFQCPNCEAMTGYSPCPYCSVDPFEGY
jgi:hypothetical protein